MDIYRILTVFSILSIIIVSYVVLTREPNQDEVELRREQREQSELQERIRRAILGVNNLTYVQDSRTNICFASYSGPHGYSHLASVDCESIPTELLYVTEIAND